MADAYCAQCGGGLVAENRFCPACGTATAEAQAAAPPVQPATFASDAAVPAAAADDPASGLLVLARIGKVVALLALLLPWATVSCAGQPLASITGIHLMEGSVSVRDPGNGTVQTHSGTPELLMFLFLAAAAFALLAGFLWPRRKAARAALWACAVALAAAVIEVYVLLPAHLRHAMTQNQSGSPSAFGQNFDRQMGEGMQQMLRIDPALGFWVAAAGLAAAIVLNWMIGQRAPEDGG